MLILRPFQKPHIFVLDDAFIGVLRKNELDVLQKLHWQMSRSLAPFRNSMDFTTSNNEPKLIDLNLEDLHSFESRGKRSLRVIN